MNKRLVLMLVAAWFVLLPLAAAAQSGWWGAPYYNDSYVSLPGAPTVSQAIDELWAEYQTHWPTEGCSYTVEPSGEGELVAIVRYTGNCGGYTDIYASRLSYDPGKNLGPCSSCPLAVGNPINPATGNKYQIEQDASFGELLQVERYYNSDPVVSKANLGPGWRHTYDRRIEYAGGGAPSDRFPRRRQTTCFHENRWRVALRPGCDRHPCRA